MKMEFLCRLRNGSSKMKNLFEATAGAEIKARIAQVRPDSQRLWGKMNAAQAIALANRSRFGLGASLWTSDPARGADLAAEIEAGSVFVNGAVKSDPRLPFGGIKSSGYGRELSQVGIREFVNVKTVWIK